MMMKFLLTMQPRTYGAFHPWLAFSGKMKISGSWAFCFVFQRWGQKKVVYQYEIGVVIGFCNNFSDITISCPPVSPGAG